jgi:glucosamine--fructose-6-phosphate aminotransferase (isomerizing)
VAATKTYTSQLCALAMLSAALEGGESRWAELARVPVLVERLSDPNPGIQHAAVLSLGRYGRADASRN